MAMVAELELTPILARVKTRFDEGLKHADLARSLTNGRRAARIEEVEGILEEISELVSRLKEFIREAGHFEIYLPGQGWVEIDKTQLVCLSAGQIGVDERCWEWPTLSVGLGPDASYSFDEIVEIRA